MGRGKNVFCQYKKSRGCVLCRGEEVGIVPKEQTFNVFNVTRGKKGKRLFDVGCRGNGWVYPLRLCFLGPGVYWEGYCC